MSSTPKDYFNEEAGTAAIAIARLRAPSGHSKGSIFVNPGTCTPRLMGIIELMQWSQVVPADQVSSS
jgi:hypothetical protein